MSINDEFLKLLSEKKIPVTNASQADFFSVLSNSFLNVPSVENKIQIIGSLLGKPDSQKKFISTNSSNELYIFVKDKNYYDKEHKNSIFIYNPNSDSCIEYSFLNEEYKQYQRYVLDISKNYINNTNSVTVDNLLSMVTDAEKNSKSLNKNDISNQNSMDKSNPVNIKNSENNLKTCIYCHHTLTDNSVCSYCGKDNNKNISVEASVNKSTDSDKNQGISFSQYDNSINYLRKTKENKAEQQKKQKAKDNKYNQPKNQKAQIISESPKQNNVDKTKNKTTDESIAIVQNEKKKTSPLLLPLIILFVLLLIIILFLFNNFNPILKNNKGKDYLSNTDSNSDNYISDSDTGTDKNLYISDIDISSETETDVQSSELQTETDTNTDFSTETDTNSDSEIEIIDSSSDVNVIEIDSDNNLSSTDTDKNELKHEQKILVEAYDKTYANLSFLEWNGSSWDTLFTAKARIGKDGLSDNQNEYSNTTPKGTFDVLFAFSAYDLDTKIDTLLIKSNTVWVNDVNSKYYNTIQSDNLPDRDWSSCEYIYPQFSTGHSSIGLAFAFNGDCKSAYSAEPNKGSVLFLDGRLKNFTSTFGDIAILNKDMNKILQYIDKDKNPIIEIR